MKLTLEILERFPELLRTEPASVASIMVEIDRCLSHDEWDEAKWTHLFLCYEYLAMEILLNQEAKGEESR